MSEGALIAWGAGGAVILCGVALGRLAPTWALLGVLFLVPLRLDVVPSANLATFLLIGAVCGRAREIALVLRDERVLLAATVAFPLWVLLSYVWARQPAFVPALFGKWMAVVLAAWLAAADRTANPRIFVAGALAATAPSALWALAERLHLIAPLGEREALHHRGISWRGSVRGRALFYHPNRLGEFIEQVGLFLAGIGLGGVWRWPCLLGVGVALAGVWATRSMGSIATLGGGLFLVAAWMAVGRNLDPSTWRRALSILGAAALAALAVGVVAFEVHEGLGPREKVFGFAVEQMREKPLLGHGAGNWPLLVGSARLGISRYWYQGHAHSLPLHVWVELGVVGVVLLVAFFAAPLWSGLRRFGSVPREWYGVGIGAAFAVAGLFAHNFVHYFLRDAVDGITTGLLLGTVVAVARRAQPVSE